MFMNTLQEIPPEGLSIFKSQVKQWLEADQKISQHESEIRELKKLRNKDLEPKITQFMRQYNISDLNTALGKVRCNERNTKKPLNRHNIRENLSIVINDSSKIDEAMQQILTNREIITTYKLVKPKVKLSIH